MSNDRLSLRERDMRRQAEMLDKNLRELDRSIQRAHDKINRVQGAENGYPVGSSFPTGVSDGFVFFNTRTRKLHMYDGVTWISIGDVGAYIQLMASIPLILAFWPMNITDSAGSFYDTTPRAKTLTNTAVGLGTLNDRLIYGTFNGTTAFLTRADEADFDITGALTFGCWVKLNTTASVQVLMSKLGGAGQRAYELFFSTGNGFCCQITSDGTTLKTVISPDPSPSTSLWYHIVGRFVPSTSVDIYVNGVKTALTTTIPATIFSSTASFNVGNRPGGSFWTNGNIAFPFITPNSLSDAYINSLYEEGVPLFT